MTEPASGYWLDLAVADILQRFPEGEIRVSSGISPSGPYHIGHFREALTADGLAWGLKQAGRQVRHLHFVDNFDPLRRRYDFLPASFEQYVGWPIYLVPDPEDCHESYAAHFFAQFEQAAGAMGIELEVYSSVAEYQQGRYTELMEQAVQQQTAIKQILEEQSRRQLPDDWTPIQLLQEDKVFRNISLSEWPEVKPLVGEGRVKFSWRVDWPARWRAFAINAEPYGKEHATKGGSYDTGKAIVALWGGEAPYPVPFETINRPGETKKMSSSLGNGVAPAEALEIMPAEILRYFVLKSRPNRVLVFDSGLGLYNLIDEYSRAELAVQSGAPHPFTEAYRVAAAGKEQKTIASVPFSHLVAVHQAALGDQAAALDILKRTGYEQTVAAERDVLLRELDYVANWLDKYAPAEVKFELQQQLPAVELSQQQKEFLAQLARALIEQDRWEGQQVHDAIYATKEALGIEASTAFAALYRVLLGQDHGPKAGWFLASLERNWLLKRLKLEG